MFFFSVLLPTVMAIEKDLKEFCMSKVLGTQDIERQLATNLWGVMYVMRAALPVMRKQRSGQIINSSARPRGTFEVHRRQLLIRSHQP